MQPINYMAMMPKEDFLDSIQGGLKLGLGLREANMKQQEHEQKLQLQQQYSQDVAAALKDPTPQAFSAITLKYPKYQEAAKQAWEMQTEAQKKAELNDAWTLASTLHANRPDIALSKIDERITAHKNSGQPTDHLEMLRKTIEADPTAAYAQVLHSVSAIPGGDKILSNLAALGKEQREAELHPDVVRKGKADADKAVAQATTEEVTAQNAPQNAILDLQKKGWDIKKLQSDIDINKQNSRIAAMNAAIAREGNDLKRQELQLKVNEAITARDTRLREKVTEVESARLNMDNMLNTVDRILSNKSLDDVLGSIEGRMPAVMGSGLDDEESDAIALIETLKSQAFLAQIPNIKGMGALSNAEGEKLQSALQNLDRAQSETQFRSSLKEAQRLVLKARKNVADRYGVPESVPDRPAVPAPQLPPGFKILGKE